MGKTKRKLLSAFSATRFRLTATATPAPNDHLELGNQAEFLGIMRANEMLARWFINDSMSAGSYRLKGHASADYWRWLCSWAASASKPSDLGDYSDAGYELPPLNLVEHFLGSELLGDYQKLSATNLHQAKRQSAQQRAERAGLLVECQSSCLPWVIWCDTNYEADALRSEIRFAVEVRGSQSIDEKEEILQAFTAGEIHRLITKPEIAGFGLNWQHCANTIFAGPSYSYEAFYQALRRFLRFGQQNTVNCHLIYSGSERSIADVLREKGQQHDLMKSKMVEYMRAFQQDELHGQRSLQASDAITTHTGEGYTLHHGDCVDVARSLPDDSIDFCIHSPPFSNLYIYSDSVADMGNAKDHGEFFEHYKFLIGELYRVTVPGRLCAVHCKDLPLYKGRDGAAGLYAFPDDIRQAFIDCGWIFHSRVTIWKDPVTEMQRTKNHGLLHRQLCKDSSASRQGMADYLLVFRKWPEGLDEFPKPVTRGSQFCRFTDYVGTQGPSSSVLPMTAGAELTKADPYSIAVWQRYASPVWFDVNQMRVLNYKLGRDDKDEKHICPLQLDVIERSLDLWTNPGDLVFDPFNGIGSTGYVALKTGRRYVGSELKDSYVRLSLQNLEQAIKECDRQQFDPQPLLPGFNSDSPAEESLATSA